MTTTITPEARGMATQIYEKINKLAINTYIVSEDDCEGMVHQIIAFGYTDDGEIGETATLDYQEQVADKVFTEIYNDLLESDHTHIVWRMSPTWLTSCGPGSDKITLRARYTLFTPKEKGNNQ